MKGIRIKIHKGKITNEAFGYKGGQCQNPIQAITDALNGIIQKEEATSEAYEPEEVECIQEEGYTQQ